MSATQLRHVAREHLRRAADLYRQRTAAMRALPDFLIVGEAKCGTTSLYEDLAAHPCVLEAAVKEVHFFDLRYHLGLDWYKAQFPLAWRVRRPRSAGAPRLQTGEASPYYMFHPHAPERIKQAIPDVKLIVLLRHPVERAYSHYQHEFRRKREALSFDDAVAREPERLRGEVERMIEDPTYNSRAHRRHAYVSRGVYVDGLLRLMTLFDRRQILVVCSEEFFSDTARVYREITAFLGLPEMRFKQFERRNTGSYAPIGAALRLRLQEYYQPHNARLYELLGRDLGWQ